MRKFSKLLTGFGTYITFAGLLILAFTFFYYSSGLNIKNLLNKASARIQNNIKPVPNSQINAWIAWWDEANAIDSLEGNAQRMVSISPVWYKIDGQGQLQKIPHKLGTEIQAIAKQSNIKIIPAITNDFDPERVSKIINNSDASRKLIQELASLAEKYEYQGFDIDWEEISPKDQEAFNLFIKNLTEFLHTYNLLVAVSVHPQTGEASDREIAKSYNLKQLGDYSDAVKIMAYDFHNQNSLPGAITPFDKLEKVLRHTSSKVSSEKIILGLPLYGYDWEMGGKKAAATSFSGAMETVEKNNGQINRDKDSYSLVGEYEINGLKHQAWFEDAETIFKMIEKARTFGIYQFSFWRLGVEDPETWLKFPR